MKGLRVFFEEWKILSKGIFFGSEKACSLGKVEVLQSRLDENEV